jgi:hypothetical protein
MGGAFFQEEPMLNQTNLESDGKLIGDRGKVNEPRPPEHFADHVELQAFIDATGSFVRAKRIAKMLLRSA